MSLAESWSEVDVPTVALRLPGLVRLTAPVVVPLPEASQAVALRASGALVPVESSQPSSRLFPDWPVPSSKGELSPMMATRPEPKVLVTKKAPVLPL